MTTGSSQDGGSSPAVADSASDTRESSKKPPPHSPSPGPWWVNAATVNGTATIVLSLVVLSFPHAGELLVRIGVGLLLVVGGASRFLFSFRNSRFAGDRTDIFQAALAIVAGVALLLSPVDTLRFIAVALGVYTGARAIASLVRILLGRKTGVDTLAVIWAVMLLALAALLLLVPETVLAGAMVVVTGLAIVVGGMMLNYGLQQGRRGKAIDASAFTVVAIFTAWLKARDIGDTGRYDLGQKLFFEKPDRTNKIVSWSVMLLLSVAIATFGVLQDSTAVVIGAMLIAPLMTPILGAAAAVVNGWGRRLARSFLTILLGVTASIGLAWIVGAWLPHVIPFASNSQITSRTNPNLIDMLIALAAGAAGAYANVDKRVSDSIAGVAIAVALVPPLAVVGLTLEDGSFTDAGGAMLLFVTNLVAIILSAILVFLLIGTAPIRRLLEQRESIRKTTATVATAALIISIPLSMTIEESLATAGRQTIAQKTVDEWLGEETNLRLERITVEGDEVAISLTGVDEVPPLESLEQDLTEQFGTPVTVIIEYVPSFLIKYSEQGGLVTEGPEDVAGQLEPATPQPEPPSP